MIEIPNQYQSRKRGQSKNLTISNQDEISMPGPIGIGNIPPAPFSLAFKPT